MVHELKLQQVVPQWRKLSQHPSYHPLCFQIKMNFATILGLELSLYLFAYLVTCGPFRLAVHDSIALSSLSSLTTYSTTGMNVGSLSLGGTLTECAPLLGLMVSPA